MRFPPPSKVSYDDGFSAALVFDVRGSFLMFVVKF
jgi:hypothetical protein